MIDQEINEQVARKLGWTENAPEVGRACWHNPQGFDCYTVPDYCQSIKAAWEIWEKLRDMGYDLQLFSSWDRRNIVCFNLTFKGDISKNYQAEADTAPMAICRAFLKLDDK